jgi:rhodanese-related sulfurtransferase
MNRKLSLAVVFFSAFAFSTPVWAQAKPPAPAWPDTVTKYIASVRKTVKTVDMKGYLAVVKNPNGALLLDVREPAEYAAGHVPGVVHIPRGVLEFVIYKQLGYPNKVDVNRKIYVQCASGGRATLATASLKRIGFKNPVAVIVNTADWEKAGHPWVKPAAK